MITVKKSDVIEDFHGTRVADPYRWLENTDLVDTLYIGLGKGNGNRMFESKAGHGLGKPTSKLINEWVDFYAFLDKELI
ncbi:hypothetical protein PY093_02660 [Cytobacillus sp. S13-E01]|uniref:hypothetical protein n=1 Tax=Cytobacillus sp. S13-E01 TaxID=3031326 RepID=UPI0023D7E125|nr:hypothetical protein [Cytobacillus sp. S13-E01]MDF0725615.1 hypothetical protein [Cytobacillus sp. S13-E01]